MLRLLLVLAIALVLIRLRYQLWVALLVTSLVTALLYGVDAESVVASVVRGALGFPTVHLIVAIYLITMLGEVLRSQGYSMKLIAGLERAIRDVRLVLAIPPILLGLLPVPAGAMMSAPLVGEIGERTGIAAEEKTFINFWFRHIWEYAWPLYPGVLLASTLVGVSYQRIVISQSPMVLVAAAVGFGYLYIRPPRPLPTDSGSGEEVKSPLLLAIWPILAIIVLVLVFRIDLVLSLVFILATLFLVHRVTAFTLLSYLMRAAMVKTFLLIVSVMVFKEILETSGGMGAFAELQTETGMSALLPLCIVPFVVGMLTGVTVAFVGVAIPIFLHLVQGDLALLFLLYLCGFAGVLLSPTHLCLVVTKDYFRADLLGVYKRLIPLVAILLAAGILIAYLRRLAGPI